MTGDVLVSTVAGMQCSGAAPCAGIELVGLEGVETVGGRVIECSNILDPVGFNCTSGS